MPVLLCSLAGLPPPPLDGLRGEEAKPDHIQVLKRRQGRARDGGAGRKEGGGGEPIWREGKGQGEGEMRSDGMQHSDVLSILGVLR